MELRFKILVLTLIVAFLPSTIVAIYVMNNIIPQYEKITYDYFVNKQQQTLERITQKIFDDMTTIAKDYAIWNELYRAVVTKDEETINFYWTSWLYQKPYNFSLIIGFSKEGKIISYHSPFGDIKSSDNTKIFKIFKKVISTVYPSDDINLIPVERGFLKINGKVFAFVCSPVLDDKDLAKPVAGALFLARDIDEFVSLIQPYIVDRIYFVDKTNTTTEENFLKNHVELFDIEGYRIGTLVIDYNEKTLVNIKRHFEKLLIITFSFLMALTLLIAFLGGVYLTRRVIQLEDYAISLFSGINGDVTTPKPNVKKEGRFKNVELILEYFSNEIKSKISILKQQDKLLKELFEKEKRNFEGAIKLLISIIEMKDPYTKGHAERVMKYSKKIGEKLFSKGYKIDLFDLEIAAYLHDIGKIVIPESILNKPDKLTQEEYSIVKRHSLDGYNILSNIEYFDNIKEVVLYHHENIDGSGYPLGIKGDKIPLESKIISVADVFDALTTDRPYRKAFSEEKALEIMKEEVGKKFDPEVFEAFLNVLKEEKISNSVEMKIDG
ncbi:metal dependent phosphohydrolase [Caldicellulosiruptor hydrothermalis 108]|uniref:Metal dependent phosphohydrolase n=1 Tax=Caldicellulosiruptor hydrothermalis (strain DSM 18901 / VKM B-2411 / 108) TaxID=632292 RepID=E4QDI1_CALH1|nr:HD domain-containing phosphohydrolase [Caldicellulosiruptor hydrothermalis]ADQ07599.1 metal dependent phosphohydrolase [Caldicellulosiruptor hydrothermalis 108]